MNNIQSVIGSLFARKVTLESSLEMRKNHKQDHSSWSFCKTEELEGRLSEVNNTLRMLGYDTSSKEETKTLV